VAFNDGTHEQMIMKIAKSMTCTFRGVELYACTTEFLEVIKLCGRFKVKKQRLKLLLETKQHCINYQQCGENHSKS